MKYCLWQLQPMLSVPIAHIHGGEQTLGSLDDGIRHAITQLSTIHFGIH